MRVYEASGPAANDAEVGAIYFRTKKEALEFARGSTAAKDGSWCTIRACEVARPISPVNLLNHEGWCPSHSFVAEVRNGRVVKEGSSK